MIEEMASIEHNQTWSLVDWPVGQHAIGLKWVFKIKKGEHENITKHKARSSQRAMYIRKGLTTKKCSRKSLGSSPCVFS
jgi:hypothetical protein